MKLLIINIGASSTKLAIYEGENEIITETIRHSSRELAGFKNLWEQLDFRRSTVKVFFEKHNINISGLSAIVSRGPVVKPLESGTYQINRDMLDDAKSGKYGIHPCGLGCQIAWELSEETGVPCFTVDPPCVDEMIDVARITGLPQIKRESFFQALNHKAKGHELAKKLDTEYEKLNLVIAHLGSGISVASHCRGKVIDVTNGLAGDSPFGLDRVGTLPAEAWAAFCISNRLTMDDLKQIINGGGGIQAHLHTNNAFEVDEMIDKGDDHAEMIFRAMAFQVGKGIGGAAAALGVRPDGIIITGGLANSKRFMGYLAPMIDWIGPLYISPDDNEIKSLAQGAVRALNNPLLVKQY